MDGGSKPRRVTSSDANNTSEFFQLPHRCFRLAHSNITTFIRNVATTAKGQEREQWTGTRGRNSNSNFGTFVKLKMDDFYDGGRDTSDRRKSELVVYPSFDLNILIQPVPWSVKGYLPSTIDVRSEVGSYQKQTGKRGNNIYNLSVR